MVWLGPGLPSVAWQPERVRHILGLVCCHVTHHPQPITIWTGVGTAIQPTAVGGYQRQSVTADRHRLPATCQPRSNGRTPNFFLFGPFGTALYCLLLCYFQVRLYVPDQLLWSLVPSPNEHNLAGDMESVSSDQTANEQHYHRMSTQVWPEDASSDRRNRNRDRARYAPSENASNNPASLGSCGSYRLVYGCPVQHVPHNLELLKITYLVVRFDIGQVSVPL